MRADGSGKHRVTSGPAYDFEASWSPDGRHLVFERDTATQSSIYSVRTDGRALTRLTSGRHFDLGPTLVPERRQIAFGSDRASPFADLWVLTVRGGVLHQISTMPGSQSFPDWKPQLRRVLS